MITDRYYRIKPLADEKTNNIKVSLNYSLGGFNVWNGQEEKRGYYCHITPVEKAGNMEGFLAFSGCKILLKECTRKSAKAEKEAREMYDTICERRQFMNYLKDNKYELEEE